MHWCIKLTHTEKNNYFDNFIFKLIHGYKAWGNLNKRNVLFISEPQDVFFFCFKFVPPSLPSMNFNSLKWSIYFCFRHLNVRLKPTEQLITQASWPYMMWMWFPREHLKKLACLSLTIR